MAANMQINPEYDQPSVNYRHKLAWKINEVDWNSPKNLILKLKAEISGTYSFYGKEDAIILRKPNKTGGREFAFVTKWSSDTEVDKIHIDAVFSIKSGDGKTNVVVGGGRGSNDLLFHPKKVANQYMIFNRRRVVVNPAHMFGVTKSISFEAEILVERKDGNKDDHFEIPNSYVKDMQSILHDDESSNVVIVAENEEFKCHKNILSARSEVFKNMFAHDTLENQKNTVNLEDGAKAVEEMLKHIYTGEIPSDSDILSIELLALADRFFQDSLKTACVENLVASLEVSTCISTFISLDQHLPKGDVSREKVLMFIKCNAEKVIETENRDKMTSSHASLAKELTRAMLKGSKEKEKHVCQYCVCQFSYVVKN
eukprot:GFUD01110846.1.p1 GENE.GFUD01110846.1~~GFUD01110846.1.p1  ORF type:complete len:370 (+),score=95.03 GFUD01110846.1:57-1166(+)